jgi:hypothetical protein
MTEIEKIYNRILKKKVTEKVLTISLVYGRSFHPLRPTYWRFLKYLPAPVNRFFADK